MYLRMITEFRMTSSFKPLPEEGFNSNPTVALRVPVGASYSIAGTLSSKYFMEDVECNIVT